MSGSRRQVLKALSNNPDVKVLVWLEPEKVSFARDGIKKAVLPILDGKADIVIPKRTSEAFATYPDFQVAYEKKANLLYNRILSSRNLRSKGRGRPYLDMWFGPRIIKNDPEVLKYFLETYAFDQRGIDTDRGAYKLDQLVNLELGPNALFLPIIQAIHDGLRVKSEVVLYQHPSIQTQTESDNEIFNRKRVVQYRNIITAAIHKVREISEDENAQHKSRLRKVE